MFHNNLLFYKLLNIYGADHVSAVYIMSSLTFIPPPINLLCFSMNFISQRNSMIDFGRNLYQAGLIAGTDGNLSVRVDENRLLITPSGAAKGRMKPEDMVMADLEGNILEGGRPASSEILMHLHAYKKRQDIKACCHAHPPHATAFAAVGKELPFDILPEIVLTLGRIPLTEFAPPGTQAVPDSLDPYIENNDAFLLRNHGVLTLGRTIEEAFSRMESVEHLAKITYIALHIGDLSHLGPDEINRLEAIRMAKSRG